MEKYHPIFWILGFLLLFAAIRLLMVLVTEAVTYRSTSLFISTAVSLLPAVLFGCMLHTAAPITLLSVAALGMTGLYAGFALGTRKNREGQRMKRRKEWGHKATIHLVLLSGSVIFMVPFLWLLSTSFKEADEVFAYPPILVPTRQNTMELNGKQKGLSMLTVGGHRVQVVELADLEDGSKTVRVLQGQKGAGKTLVAEPGALKKIRGIGLRWENYRDALTSFPAGTFNGLLYVWNTLYITILSIIGTIISSSMVAYSFSRLRWPGRDLLFGILLGTMMLPGAVTMVPVFLIFRWLGWVDTPRPLWLPSFFGGAFSVFLLRQFFLTIPKELEDAAKIDGCSYFGIYRQIMLPMVKPALAALTIMTFMGSWNNFMGPLIYISTPEKMPVSYALQLFQGIHMTDFGPVMAASTMVMLPVLLLFFFTQRYFIQGITLTGIKG